MVGNTRRTADPRRIRRLKSPQALEVEADASGVPLRLRLGGDWQQVTLAAKPWRLDQYWWRGEPIRREYFRVSPEAYPAFTLYHDLVTGAWSRQEY